MKSIRRTVEIIDELSGNLLAYVTYQIDKTLDVRFRPTVVDITDMGVIDTTESAGGSLITAINSAVEDIKKHVKDAEIYLYPESKFEELVIQSLGFMKRHEGSGYILFLDPLKNIEYRIT